MINLLLITLITVFIIDLSGIIDELEHSLSKWLNKKSVHIPKPFSCSLCMTWWTGLIYLLVIHNFTFITIAYCALLAYLTPVFGALMQLVKDLLTKAVNIVYNALNL